MAIRLSVTFSIITFFFTYNIRCQIPIIYDVDTILETPFLNNYSERIQQDILQRMVILDTVLIEKINNRSPDLSINYELGIILNRSVNDSWYHKHDTSITFLEIFNRKKHLQEILKLEDTNYQIDSIILRQKNRVYLYIFDWPSLYGYRITELSDMYYIELLYVARE